MTFAFHISREARERYDVENELFTLTGNAVLLDFAAGRRLAQRMNERDTLGEDSTRTVHAGQLNAMGLLDEILHAVVARYREDVNPAAMAAAAAFVASRVGADALRQTLEAFVDRFPTADAVSSRQSAADYLAGSTLGMPNRDIALEELLMVWLSNANPALRPFERLFDDAPLATPAPYTSVIEALIAYFGTQPPFGPDGQTLIEMLRAPMEAVPDSIAGQLRFVRERWLSVLTQFGDRLIGSLDVLAEEERGLWRRFHPDGGDVAGAEELALRADPAWLTESGWSGDATAYGPDGQGSELERFSVDRDWMPRLVLLAKSSFVWLDQLSKRYGRPISRLDEIPEEELDQLARWGFTGLWLIGLWQRSQASQTIKQLRGNPEAVASAYSLDDYRIADDLGGEEAFERLKARAWQRGIRIASDMVPNHMGVDSRWVIDHPEWFMSLSEPPYPSYRFTGPDLSSDPNIGIQIEDHYFDNTDAAVVFRRWDRGSGESRYVYHGNDGTSMPWNDTAQLDYLRPDVREAVIQTILGVARRSPVIRFDAAMTLAKKHIERLWYPEPGHGGAIPSRSEHALPKAAFEQAMPLEFWREVVDRVAAEVPDTLLLAEAFWLMEGYFVRTLGMHRVYNSAFMHMLRDEQNANYRAVMKNTLEFDPEVLKRYVNFMNNPDEKTAVAQFGKGDKYFGVATLMVTLPGLPMFGHGQVEGFTEKYGMEYRRAYWDEQPDRWLIERHEREIAPLLHRRRLFAEVDDFLLFDFVREDGDVDEDVYAYSNRGGGEASLIVFNNRYGTASGSIRQSAPYSARAGEAREVVQRTLGEGLGLHADAGWFVALHDVRTGLEALHASDAIHRDGLRLDLDGYACRVYLGVREVQDVPGRPWGRLAAELGRRGVPNLDDALRDLLLRPVQEPLRRLLDPDRLAALAGNGADGPTDEPVRARTDRSDGTTATTSDGAAGRIASAGTSAGAAAPDVDSLIPDVAALLTAARDLLSVDRPSDVSAPSLATAVAAAVRAAPWAIVRPQTTRQASPAIARSVDAAAATAGPPADAAAVTAAPPAAADRTLAASWRLFDGMRALVDGDGDGAVVGHWIEDWRLGPVVADAFRAAGLPEADAWRAVEAVKALLTLPAWDLNDRLSERVERILAAWRADESAVRFLQVTVHRDVRWFNKEAFASLASWAAVVDAVRQPTGKPEDRADTVEALVEAAAGSGYRVDALVAPATAQRGNAGSPSA